jgi:predicted acetyltransferase
VDTTHAVIEAAVDIVPAAPEEQSVLANLLELYSHDFSELYDIDLGADGRYGYTPLPLYWTEPGRHPFLVRLDGTLAGFVLVKRGSEVSRDPDVWDLAEFFIVRRHRRRRLGLHVAHHVWRRFPGRWEVRVMPANRAAQAFWARAIREWTSDVVSSVPVERDGKSWQLFAFDSRAHPAP